MTTLHSQQPHLRVPHHPAHVDDAPEHVERILSATRKHNRRIFYAATLAAVASLPWGKLATAWVAMGIMAWVIWRVLA